MRKIKNQTKKFNFGGALKDTGLFLADNALSEWAPNAIKQDQYSDTDFGKMLGHVSTVNESFSSKSPISQLTSKLGTPGNSQNGETGYTEDEQALYNKVQPIAQVGSTIGSIYSGGALGSIGSNIMNNQNKMNSKQNLSNTNGNMAFARLGGRMYSNGGINDNIVPPINPNRQVLYMNGRPAFSNSLTYPRTFADGGMNIEPNAEVEKQENTLNPDGSTDQYNGESHENGGIPTNLDPGTLIFSDKLKVPNTKKTFADINKDNMTAKEDKVLENPKTNYLQKITAHLMKSVKNQKSLNLFNEQETLKQDKVKNYAKKLGVNLPSNGSSQGEYSNGGIHNKSFYRYDDGGIQPSPRYQDDSEGIYPEPQSSGLNQWSSEAAMENNPNDGYYGDKASNFLSSLNSSNSGNNTPITNNGIPRNGYNYNSNAMNYIAQGIGAIGQNVGNIYDINRSKNVPKETYNRVTPNYLDPSAELNYNNQVFAKGANDVKNASGGDASTYINNRKDLAINNMTTNSRIKMQYDMANAEIGNQAKYYNAGTGDRETIANLMNQAQGRNLKGAALSNIGNNVSNSALGMTRDANMQQRDQQYLKIIATKYPEIMKDPDLKQLFQ